MRLLQWWMRLVGVFYLFFAGALLPFGTGPGKPLENLAFEQQHSQRMEDWQFFFGLQMAVIGIVLLYASGRPRDNRILVWLVVLGEGLRGVLGMSYYLSRGAPPFLFGILVFTHLLITLSGIDFARRARREDTYGQRPIHE